MSRASAALLVLLAIGLASALPARPARASEPQLVGLFEGHGIAPPKDAKRARSALVAAQRFTIDCYALQQREGGGTGARVSVCGDAAAALARLGPDAASALLDTLDHPRLLRGARFEGGWAAELTPALIGTGRADLVPVLVTALERAETRAKDPRTSDLPGLTADAITLALQGLTYQTRLQSSEQWRTWWEQNKTKGRAAWRSEAIARIRVETRNPDPELAIEAAFRLEKIPEARNEALAVLRRIVRRPSCAKACDSARYHLNDLEPRGGWLR